MLLDTIALPDGKLAELQPYQKQLLADLNTYNPHLFRPPYRRGGTSSLLSNYILAHMVRDMAEDDNTAKRVLIVSETIHRATSAKDYIMDIAAATPLTSSQQMLMALHQNIKLETISAFARAYYGTFSLVFFNGIRQKEMESVHMAMQYMSRANPKVKCVIELYS